MRDFKEINTRNWLLKMIGIMQGRLTDAPYNESLDWFPFDTWRREFQIAKILGFDYIELVVDKESSNKNPILSVEKMEEIKNEISNKRLSTPTCCINFIINNNIVEAEQRRKIQKIAENLQSLKVKHLILPLFGASDPREINTPALGAVLNELSIIGAGSGLNLLIESNLDKKQQLSILEKVKNTKNIGIVYDIGNMKHCGFDLEDDLELLFQHIKLIHIKDKDEDGKNVRLGTGNVDFNKTLKLLSEKKYTGDFTLETSRGKNAVAEAEINFNFIKSVTAML